MLFYNLYLTYYYVLFIIIFIDYNILNKNYEFN